MSYELLFKTNPIKPNFKGKKMLLRLTINGRRESNIKIDIPANCCVLIVIDAIRNTQYDIPDMFKNISIIGDGAMGTVWAYCSARKVKRIMDSG